VKKLVAFLLMLALICSLGITGTGCSKKAEEKKATPPAENKEPGKKP
jgi:hypothetical protein